MPERARPGHLIDDAFPPREVSAESPREKAIAPIRRQAEERYDTQG